MKPKTTKSIAEDGRPFYKFNVRDKRVTLISDVHFPNQDTHGLTTATLNNRSSILFLNGDMGDMEGLNRFPKDPEKIVKKNSILKEKDAWARWLDKWVALYDHIIIGPGNHERRAYNMLYQNAAFVGMGWWWPYGDLFCDSRFTVLDVGYRAELDFGTTPRVFLEHGDELRGAGSKCPAAGVAENNPGEHIIIFGHTHRAARVTHTRYFAGKKKMTTAVNTGHLSDTRKNGYANDPNWQRGCLYLGPDELDLQVW